MLSLSIYNKLQFNFYKVAVPIIALLMLGCSNPTIYITGDEKAIGAAIFVDGEKVGLMTEHIYRGSDVNSEIVAEREEELQKELGIRRGDKFSGINITVPRGEHKVMVVGKDDRKLETTILVKGGEMYGEVNFKEMTIAIE